MVFLRPLISAALILFVLWKAGPSDVANGFASSRLESSGLAAALSVVFVLLKTSRWSFMLRKGGMPCSLSDSLRSYLGGMSVGLVTPGRVGELARALFLPIGRRSVVVALAFADKILDVTCVFLAATVGAFALLGPSAGVPAAAVSLVLLVGVLTPGLLRVFMRLIGRWKGLAARAEDAITTLGLISIRDRLVALLVAMAALLVAVFQFHLILNSFESQPFLTSLTVMPLMVMANFLPFVLSGVGAREGLSVVLLSPYGVKAPTAVNTALLLFLLNTAGPAVLGALVARRRAPAREEAT